MKRLRIAVLATNLIRIPPRPRDVPPGFSGAPEEIVSTLTEALVERGHDVTLFASGDSKTRAKLVSILPRATSAYPAIGFSADKPHIFYEMLLACRAFAMAQKNKFDIIHSHLDLAAAYFAPFIKTPLVTTVHSPLKGPHSDVLNALGKNQYFISVSRKQREPLPHIRWIATIYHGIDTEKIPWSADATKNEFITVGRIKPQKGIKEAILSAKKAGATLVIYGSHEQDEYWQKDVKPYIDNKKIIYRGFVPKKELFRACVRAKGFLASLKWEEPFGLALVEAMACGTPVIAFNRGSVPEIIADGKTGFIVKNSLEMAEKMKAIDGIKRLDCRRHVEKKIFPRAHGGSI